MPVQETPQTPQPWAIVVAIALGVGAIWGAAKVIGQIIQAAADDYVLSVLRRKQPELKAVVTEMLTAELSAAKLAGERAASAHQLAESNTRAISGLAGSVAQLTGAVNTLPRIAQTLETCTDTLEELSGKLDRVASQVNYMHGVVDQMRAPGVAIPAGTQLPVGR